MKKIILASLIILSATAFGARPKHQFVRLKTDKGECVILLYNETPLHRDNFIKLTREGYYDGTLFHRVIHDFMIQGGDPNSKNAQPGQMLGLGGPEYRIPAEIRPDLFHRKGALAAARDNNPEKASSGSQFYIVQGAVLTDEQLDQFEASTGKKISPEQRNIYKILGGTPHLDQNYTVFGDVITGIELIDTIAAVETDSSNRPVNDVKITVTLLKNKEARKIEKTMSLAARP
jgi:cyclophilin family peptidyl-prolyl cis-trans isomerase